MFCIVGLGNPGPQYQLTRHNAGFLVLQEIAKKSGIPLERKGFDSVYGKGRLAGHEAVLVMPQTYMNLSGRAVNAVVQFYKVSFDQILVIYDDLDLPPGAIRLRPAGSAGGHKGLTSIITLLGTQAISRLRLGIGRPEPGRAVPDYVLTPFSAVEKPLIEQSIAQAAEAAESFVVRGIDYAMNHFNKNEKETST